MIRPGGVRSLVLAGEEKVRGAVLSCHSCSPLRLRPPPQTSTKAAVRKCRLSTSFVRNASTSFIRHSLQQTRTEVLAQAEALFPQAGESSQYTKGHRSSIINQLALVDEAIDSLATAPKYFHNEPESRFLLEEAQRFAIEQCSHEDEIIQDRAQAQAIKVAAAFIRLHKEAEAIGILQTTISFWTAEKEETYRDLWMPVVALTYATGLTSTALQILAVLNRKAGPSDDWVDLAYLQCLLRTIEKGEQAEIKDIVDTWWKIFEGSSKPVPLSVMVLLLESQVKRGELDRVRVTLQKMQRLGLQVTSDVWAKAFWPSLRGKRDKQMFDLLISCTANTQEVADGLASHFAENRNLKECLRVLKRFGIPIGSWRQDDKSRSIASVSLPICTAMATVWSRRSHPDRALRYLNIAINNRCEGTYTPIFQELCFAFFSTERHWEAFLLGIQLMKIPHRDIFIDKQLSLRTSNTTALLTPTHRKYSTLLSAVSYFGDISSMVPATRILLLDMFSHGVNVTNKVRKSLALIVKRLGRDAGLERLREYVRDPLKADKGAVSLTDEHATEWNKFVQVLHSEAVVDSFKVGLWRRSPVKYRNADREGRAQLDDFKFLSPISDLAQLKQEADRAISVPTYVYVAPSDLDPSTPLTSAGYAIRLKVFAVVRQDFDAAKAIYKSMLAQGIRITKYHLSPLIEGLASVDKSEEAHQLWREASIREPELSMSEAFYSALVRGYEKRQDWSAILSVAGEMERKKVEVSRQLDMSFRAVRALLNEERASVVVRSRSDLIHDEKRYGQLREEIPKVKEVQGIQDLVREFVFFQKSRQFLTAQRIVSKALKEGVVADSRLRKALDRSDNYLRKQLMLENVSRNPRRAQHITSALEVCRDNRAKAKGNAEQLAELNKRLHEESKQRHALFLLLRDALASDSLREEAAARKAEREAETAL